MTARSANTQDEALNKILHSLADIKTMPDADLSGIVLPLESMIIKYVQQQHAGIPGQQPPGMGQQMGAGGMPLGMGASPMATRPIGAGMLPMGAGGGGMTGGQPMTEQLSRMMAR